MATLFFRKAKHKMTCLVKIHKFDSGAETACCYVGINYLNTLFGVRLEDLPKDLKKPITFSSYLPDSDEWFIGYDFDVKVDLVPIKPIIADLDAFANQLARYQK